MVILALLKYTKSILLCNNDLNNTEIDNINNDISSDNKRLHDLSLDDNNNNNKIFIIQMTLTILCIITFVLYYVISIYSSKSSLNTEELPVLNIDEIQYIYYNDKNLPGINKYSNNELFIRYDQINEQTLTNINNNNIMKLVICINDDINNLANSKNVTISKIIYDKLIENHYNYNKIINKYDDASSDDANDVADDQHYDTDTEPIDYKIPINLNSIEFANNDNIENINTNTITIPKDEINEIILRKIHNNPSITKLIVSNVDYLNEIYHIFQSSDYTPPNNIHPYECICLDQLNITYYNSTPNNISNDYNNLDKFIKEKKITNDNNIFAISNYDLKQALQNNKAQILRKIQNNVNNLLIYNILTQYELEKLFQKYYLYVNPDCITYYGNVIPLKDIKITYRWTRNTPFLIDNLKYMSYKTITKVEDLHNNTDTKVAINKNILNTNILQDIKNDVYIAELMIFNIGKKPNQIKQRLDNISSVQKLFIENNFFVNMHNIDIYTRKLIYIDDIKYIDKDITYKPNNNEYILSKININVKNIKLLNQDQSKHINTLIMTGINSKQEVINLLYKTDFHAPKHPSIISEYVEL